MAGGARSALGTAAGGGMNVDDGLHSTPSAPPHSAGQSPDKGRCPCTFEKRHTRPVGVVGAGECWADNAQHQDECNVQQDTLWMSD